MILGETEGFVKVVTDAKYDEVLGVHIIGPHATDLAEACVAMGLEATAEELGHIMHASDALGGGDGSRRSDAWDGDEHLSGRF